MEDLVQALSTFHREVLVPDIQRIVDTALGQLRDEMHTYFDAIYQRFDRLETEYQWPD